MAKSGRIEEAEGYSPPLFQICELVGLASHCVNLWILACNTTHIYLNIKEGICDWIWEKPPSKHNYKYLEILNLIIWSSITREGK